MSKTENLKKMLPSASFSVGSHLLNAAFAAWDYSSARDEGHGVLSSAGQAAIGFALPEIIGTGTYMGAMLVPALGGLAVDTYDYLNQQLRENERFVRNQNPFRSHTFVDGPQIYTMRQAGLALARRAKYDLQQTSIGNEARFLHR